MNNLNAKLKRWAEKSAAEAAKQCRDGELLPDSKDDIPAEWEIAERDFLETRLGEQRIPFKLFDRYLEFLVDAYQKENEELLRPGDPRHD